VRPAGQRRRDVRETATGRLLFAYRNEGDTRARDRLVQLYLPLVETLARRYRGQQAEYDDLLQAGSIGLLNAIERCDPGRSDEFTAFAVPTVAGEMKRYIRDRGAMVRLPRPLHEAAGRLPKTREQLTRRLGRTPTDVELAEAVGVTPAELGELEAALRAPAQDGGTETMADPRARSSDERLVLAGAFEVLDDQEREIVFLRYVEDLDRKQVAERLGISESQIGRRTRTALAKLRRELEEDGMQRAANGEDAKDGQAAPVTKPEPAPAKQPEADKSSGGHSGRLLLRMPRPLHDDLAEAAEREDLSLNRYITGILTSALHSPSVEGAERVEHAEQPELEAREVPRWLPAAIVANIVVVAVAAIVAVVLLVIAWQNGW
jgi:RNA polymerase sigma factor (sigma-70 family)